ncbi:hypothetical protein [Escherichia coli]|nr:hypothetical protein [Escherichia coli]KEL81500.1 traG domain protein [Escherichia coli 5-366-08_S3_C1]
MISFHENTQVVERQMSYMRQQLSARMLSRYQNNYHFGGNSL